MTAYTIRRVIQHNTTKSLIDGVVRWLKTEPSPNDAEWQAHTDLVQACLEEMVEMSVNPSKEASPKLVHRPGADKLNQAMPHVRSMLIGMWEHDRTTALAHGETTLQHLYARHSDSSRFSVTQNHPYGSIIFECEKCAAMNHSSAN
jgi:hypothetical protein